MTSFLRSFFKAPEMDPVMAPVMGPVASPTANNAVCDSEGFYQHLGECWNDTIQMIFLFSDGIKEIIQPSLLDPNFDSKVESIINDEKNKLVFTFITDLFGLKTTKTMKNFANPFGLANSSNSEILDNKVSERKKAIIEYFKVLKRRFMRHYHNEAVRRHSLCDEETANEHSIFETMSQISRAAGQDGIAAAALGHINTKGVNRSHINIEELRKKREEKKYSPGGSSIDEEYLFKLYKLVFFDKYEFKYNIFNLPYESIGILSIPIKLSEISKDLIQNSKAVDITSYIIDKDEQSEGHATAFYTCGGSQIYYDDNSGIYSFPWKEFLLKAVELYEKDATTQLICGNNKEGYNKIEIQKSSFYPIIRTLNDKDSIEIYKYYTFIDNSLLLESNDGYFEYNGVSINVPNRNLRKITGLVFMTINNDQAVNAQRFNHTARHGLINWSYYYDFLIIQPNPDAEKILEFLNKYIESKNFNYDTIFKDNLTYGIRQAIIQVRPINTLLNIKLLELAEAYLDPTEVEELRKLTIPDPPHVGGYRKKRKTRHRKQSIKRKTLKKQKS